MSTQKPQYPKASSDLLSGIIDAFGKRSKALKHKNSKPEIECFIDEGFERVNFDFGPFPSIRLAVWEDGSIWFRVCEGGKDGWDVLYAFDAYTNAQAPQLVVKTFEASLVYIEDKAKVMHIWNEFDPKDNHLQSR